MSQRRGALVGLQSLVRRVRTRVALLEFRQVPVVVPLHLVVEHLKAESGGGVGYVRSDSLGRYTIAHTSSRGAEHFNDERWSTAPRYFLQEGEGGCVPHALRGTRYTLVFDC